MSECTMFCEDKAQFLCAGCQYKNILSVTFNQKKKKIKHLSSRELRNEPAWEPRTFWYFLEFPRQNRNEAISLQLLPV